MYNSLLDCWQRSRMHLEIGSTEASMSTIMSGSTCALASLWALRLSNRLSLRDCVARPLPSRPTTDACGSVTETHDERTVADEDVESSMSFAGRSLAV